jgi:hypothetical protein
MDIKKKMLTYNNIPMIKKQKRLMTQENPIGKLSHEVNVDGRQSHPENR